MMTIISIDTFNFQYNHLLPNKKLKSIRHKLITMITNFSLSSNFELYTCNFSLSVLLWEISCWILNTNIIKKIKNNRLTVIIEKLPTFDNIMLIIESEVIIIVTNRPITENPYPKYLVIISFLDILSNLLESISIKNSLIGSVSDLKDLDKISQK